MGKTFDIAAESLTGNDLARKISKALGRPVTYARFPAELLAQQPVLARLVELVDEGTASGDGDVAAIRELHPGLLTFDAWLERTGKAAIERLSQ